jgi:hypothetical protein
MRERVLLWCVVALALCACRKEDDGLSELDDLGSSANDEEIRAMTAAMPGVAE